VGLLPFPQVCKLLPLSYGRKYQLFKSTLRASTAGSVGIAVQSDSHSSTLQQPQLPKAPTPVPRLLVSKPTSLPLLLELGIVSMFSNSFTLRRFRSTSACIHN